MTGPEHDEEFERYLQQRSLLPRDSVKADRLEPPPELDRAVLAHAQDAIRAPKPAKVYRSARWTVPFGLAATVLIAFGVFLQMRPIAQQTHPIASAAPVRTLSKARELAAPAPLPPAEIQRSPMSPAYARTRQEPNNEFSSPLRKAVLSPSDWRAKIARLRVEGKQAEAEREQAAFHKAYPNERPSAEGAR